MNNPYLIRYPLGALQTPPHRKQVETALSLL
ncbi:hypothetical protein FLM9_1235 [Candidatus Synechococcus spongiarum]|uniref:Uncharacterized protein n=1 Tax=Candidatus Synechococcus spongiarum TaxID=431041 RepID=A0A165B327_9SYNE|nr:hypothetical protein FLM9_1235 [Candidatus Synechococcus spongiarum]